MKILIRVESGNDAGIGHLVRCLSVAKVIRKTNSDYKIIFLVRADEFTIKKLDEELFDYIIISDQTEEDFISKNIIKYISDVIFIDKLYNYSAKFIKSIRQKTGVVMMHNYCDGAYYCNSYIFPGAHTDPLLIDNDRWKHSGAIVFSGYDYLILNNDILKLRRITSNNKNKKKIVITTGGSDPKGVLIQLINWLNAYRTNNTEIWALVGDNFCFKEKLIELSGGLSSNIHITDYNPRLFTDADIAISTFGISTYELLSLGLPILSIGHSKQNALGSRVLSAKCEALIDLGLISDLSKEVFLSTLDRVLINLSHQIINTDMIDGKGSERIAEIIIQIGEKNEFTN